MKKKAKASKSAKRSSAPAAAPEPSTPDLVAVMMKIAERLEALEKKTDAVMQRLEARSHQQNQHQPRPQQHHPNHGQAHGNQHPQRQHEHPQHRPVPQPNLPQQQQQQQRQAQPPQQQKSRPLYQAVCADCRANCEVPFQPAEGRAVYCKECFAKRRNGGQAHKPQAAHAPQAQELRERQISVTRKGVGKVTISELVPAGALKKDKKPRRLAKKSR